MWLFCYGVLTSNIIHRLFFYASPTAAAAAVQAADGMAVVVDQAVSTPEGFLF